MTRRERLRMVGRSFLVDAVWNFRRHQNVGFLYVLMPGLERIWKDRDQLAAAFRRHTRYVSTHHAMTLALAGWTVRQEERLRDDPATSPQEGQRLKGLMMGPLAAMGDALFWSALKPLVLLAGVVAVVMGPHPAWKIAGVAAGLIGYNLVKGWIMWRGLGAGYSRGIAVVGLFQGVPAMVGRLQTLGVIVAAGAAALMFPWTTVSWMGYEIMPSFLALATIALFSLGLRMRISSTALFYSVIVACVGLAYVLPLGVWAKVEVPW